MGDVNRSQHLNSCVALHLNANTNITKSFLISKIHGFLGFLRILKYMPLIVYFLGCIFDVERPIPEATRMKLKFYNSLENKVEIGDFWVVDINSFEELNDLRDKYGEFCIRPGKKFGMEYYFLLFLR